MKVVVVVCVATHIKKSICSRNIMQCRSLWVLWVVVYLLLFLRKVVVATVDCVLVVQLFLLLLKK